MLSRERPSDTAAGSPNPSETRRRKTRKGTHSCWECKRRKVRCSYSIPSDPCCIGCRRRGTRCVSQQDVDERTATASSIGSTDRHLSDRMVRVEALLEQLASQIVDGGNKNSFAGNENPSGGNGSESDLATSCSPQEMQSFEHLSPMTMIMDTPFRVTGYESVSAALYAALPPREDIHLMIKAGLDVSLHRLMTHSLAVLSQCPGGWSAGLADMPNAGTHPTLLAKYMLILATCLQFAHPELHADEIHRLSEPPRQLMRRVADTAISLVTSKDEFLNSVEALECVMLESLYLANGGNLRRAWFACRRAMVVAQMLGLHRGDCQQPPHLTTTSQTIVPNFFWFRIVCTDRQLCLMLGLPQGSLDVSMATEAALANDSPSGQFERKQCVIASRILAHNEMSGVATNDDFTAVLELDSELQQAANEMPGQWWLVPNLASSMQDKEKTFWEMLRLIEQMLYFNLLNLLHLPYMLRSNKPSAEETDKKFNYEYSKMASINASRELLTRFIMLRSFNRVAFFCRAVDFFAITAAMTLVIAHLDGHRKQRQRQYEGGVAGINVLAHQRNGDRAMMEKVLENMEGVAKLSTDALSQRSASLLKSLLALEVDAAEGKPGASGTEAGHSLQLGIPYFGTVRISSDGVVVSMESPPSYTTEQVDGYRDFSVLPSVQTPLDGMAAISATPQQTLRIPQTLSPVVHFPEPTMQQSFAPPYPTAINDVLHQQYLYPGLTADADEWTFQGVDTVFFHSLMRGFEGETVYNTGPI
ncbi:hypothetical protein P153DRAFT_427380 [Dothidotthia symphoricarpi CBS 119687]|uniref:Zn(2)-C6 fungal-type domain-containing protein n=1 Tax=Dothidotthia symphoricarpi CBS 119687 TaxID=1392245 RepID=A0A6A6AU52_9PLEO|nr:uncharacterized protein P153DRAFT_427380 [Dothidotthia symphoricarpi CBS 119687]KAF2134733.1 hypothetical protein P153DRAFT_427380 [Dothidotthia symphoricarpi CBS 119687]